MRLMKLCAVALSLLLPLSAAGVTLISKGAAVTVGTTATLMEDPSLATVQDGETMRRPTGLRTHVMVYVPEGQTIYCGGRGVTTATGMPVSDGERYSVPAAPEGTVWCVASAPVAGVRVQESF